MYALNLVKHKPNPTVQCGTGMQWHPHPPTIQQTIPPTDQTKF